MTKILVYAVTDMSFYFDAGKQDCYGAQGNQYYHGHATHGAPWSTCLKVSGEIWYDRNHITGSVVWDPHAGWDGNLGHDNGRINPLRRDEFLREQFGFRNLGNNHLVLGYEFKAVPLKYGEVGCYHNSLDHMAWTFRTKNTNYGFDGLKFNEQCSHKLIKFHSQLVRVI